MAKIDILNYAKKILLVEANEIKSQTKYINEEFVKAVNIISDCGGKLVVFGIGKSGVVGRKIAATFNSVGIPAVFIYPPEILHGELGLVSSSDVIIFVSYSGETEELKKISTFVKNLKVKTISITSRTHSWLGKISDAVLNIKIKKEACPYNLIPTSSAVSMLAVGDALALSVAKIKGFKKSDYLRYHPGGITGRKVSIKIKDIMRKNKDNPILKLNSTVKDALFVMTRTKLGATSIVDDRNKIVGYFTDGDLRRELQRDPELLEKKISLVMTKNPKTISPEKSIYEAAKLLQKYKCDNMPVVDENNVPIGIVDERDLVAIGIL